MFVVCVLAGTAVGNCLLNCRAVTDRHLHDRDLHDELTRLHVWSATVLMATADVLRLTAGGRRADFAQRGCLVRHHGHTHSCPQHPSRWAQSTRDLASPFLSLFLCGLTPPASLKRVWIEKLQIGLNGRHMVCSPPHQWLPLIPSGLLLD
jgi:hypothetical protein